jgi:hypothetical protein
MACSAIPCSKTINTSLQLLTPERPAIWLEDGRIVCGSKRYMNARLNEVDDVDLHYWHIRFRLKNGRSKSINPLYLLEAAELIIRRLKEVLPDQSRETQSRNRVGIGAE